MDSDATRPRPRQTRRLVPSGLLVACLGACGSPRHDVPGPGVTRGVVLLVSGDTAGWIVPCGCTSNQSGGLPRRASYARRLRAERPLVLADAGGAPGGTSPYDRLKFEAILAGERAMGVAAHNLGGPESALGEDGLKALRGKAPFVSANLRDGRGSLVADPLRIVTEGGVRIALVGVVSPRLVRGGLKADDPRTAVLDAVRDAGASYDALVVLAYLPEAELRQLAADLPEADLVVGGPTGQSIAPVKVGPTWIGSATNKGKFLIAMETAGPQAPWAGRVVEMGPSIADDPAQRRNLDAFHAELGRRDLPAELTGIVPSLPADLPDDYRLAGSASCLPCHKEDGHAWERSKHAHAYSTLHDGGNHVDPQCQKCHTVGYGLPGGFRSVLRSPERTAVGCESCHGPAQAHVQHAATRTPFAARDQCSSCHDPENSPAFVFDTYWAQIRHGSPAGHVVGKEVGK